MKIKLNKITKLTIILVVLLGLANLVGTNILATGGNELESIRKQTIILEKDNLYLKNKIALVTSLALIEEQSKNLGFVPISQTIAITASTPVAYVAE